MVIKKCMIIALALAVVGCNGGPGEARSLFNKVLDMCDKYQPISSQMVGNEVDVSFTLTCKRITWK